MSANVVPIDHLSADAEMRRIRKGMAEHDCSMKTFIYIDRLEGALARMSDRLDILEAGLQREPGRGFAP